MPSEKAVKNVVQPNINRIASSFLCTINIGVFPLYPLNMVSMSSKRNPFSSVHSVSLPFATVHHIYTDPRCIHLLATDHPHYLSSTMRVASLEQHSCMCPITGLQHITIWGQLIWTHLWPKSLQSSSKWNSNHTSHHIISSVSYTTVAKWILKSRTALAIQALIQAPKQNINQVPVGCEILWSYSN
jgi:hypothetical protein